MRVLFMIIILTACAQPAQAAPPAANADSRVLWAVTVKPMLDGFTWTASSAYDAGSVLMLPMYSSFQVSRVEHQMQFAKHFAALVTNWDQVAVKGLNRMKYLHLPARFLVLASQYKKQSMIPPALADLLYADVAAWWMTTVTPRYDGVKAPNMREHILWKLSKPPTAKHYYTAITDHEITVMAIAADLQSYRRLNGLPSDPLLEDIAGIAERVFTELVVWTDGRWLLQPGIWDDYPDYAYAGQMAEVPGMAPKPVPGIAWDSSHYGRMALWLQSFATAPAPKSARHTLYKRLMAGLEKQFYEVVLVPPSADVSYYRTTNYMDGHNGVYRWQYASLGPNEGYGPYELGGSVVGVGWRYLGTERIRALYSGTLAMYPLSDEELAFERGPGTSRAQDPLVANFETNGFGQLQAGLAADKRVGQCGC